MKILAYQLLIIISTLLFFSCEEEIDKGLKLTGTWQGTTASESTDQYWIFWEDSVSYTAGSKVAIGLFEYGKEVKPNTLIIKFIEHKDANARLEGKEYWGILEYVDSKLTIGFTVPLGTKAFPTSLTDGPTIKKWELKKKTSY